MHCLTFLRIPEGSTTDSRYDSMEGREVIETSAPAGNQRWITRLSWLPWRQQAQV
jgi:hypothetical protein